MVDLEDLCKEILIAAIRNHQRYLDTEKATLENKHRFLTQTAIMHQLWDQVEDRRGYRSKYLLATAFRELEERNWLKKQKGKHKALLYFPTDLGKKVGGEYLTQGRSIADDFAGKQSFLLDLRQKSSSSNISDILQALRYHFEHQIRSGQLLSTVSSRFASFTSFADAMNASLIDIGRFLGADRAFIVLFQEQTAWAPNIYEWCGPGVQSAKSLLNHYEPAKFPWALQKLGTLSHIWMQDEDVMTEQQAPEQDLLWDQDARSLLFLPLFAEKAFRGIFGIADLQGSLVPTGEDVSILRVCCQMISASLAQLETNYALTRRVRELSCLYEIGEIAQHAGLSLRSFLLRVVKLLPPAWQYSDIAGSRITLGSELYATPGFRVDAWTQAADIISHGKRVGSITVSYSEQRPDGGVGEGPFLREERQLLDDIAKRLGRVIERRRADDVLQEYYNIIYDD
ncbi:MAG: hypothetical protein ACXAB4_06620 [Candidatus Hodarchaeales archaeon]|jgi:GAF domain-containing protein